MTSASGLLVFVLLAPALVQGPGSTLRDPTAGQRPASPAGTAVVGGAVTVADNGQASPLRRARVTLRADAGGATQTSDTDTDGKFQIDHVSAGSYAVVVDKAGFVPQGRVPIITVVDATRTSLAVRMQRAGAIEGRLTTDAGEPAAGITVSAVRLGFGPYGKKSVAAQQTTTDDLGRYRLHTLPAGDYYIDAAPDPLRMANLLSVNGAAKPTRTYFAGTPRLSDARPVTVAAGVSVPDVDLTLSSALLSALTARVTTSSGAPPATFAIRIQRVGFPPGEVRCYYGLADPSDNGFNCPNVAPGDFYLLVSAKPALGALTEYGLTRVTLDGHVMPTVAIVTAAGTPVSGRIEVENAAAMPAAVQVALLETDYEFPADAPAASVALNTATPPRAVGADGGFLFPSVGNGPLLFRVNGLPAGWVVKHVFRGDADITDTPTSIAVVPGEIAKPIRIVISSATGSVGGAVVNDAGSSAAGTRVVVFADDPAKWGARSRFIKSVPVGSSGQYNIAGLLPGKYLVCVVETLDDGAWEDPEVLARLKPGATPTAIAAGDRQTLDWKLK